MDKIRIKSGLKDMDGPRRRKEKKQQFFRQTIKVRNNFVWEKLLEFLLFTEILMLNKVGSIILILSKFQTLNSNLWSVFSKRFKYLVHTFHFYVLRNSFFFKLLRRRKRLKFWILDLKVGLTLIGMSYESKKNAHL